jgi:nitrogen fixation-related uncharacterized protein
MEATLILVGLLIGLTALDMAASRWGVDSTDAYNDLDHEWHRHRN